MESRIDFCIKATKLCTKALMKLSYRNYLRNEKLIEGKISNKNILNNDY
jgi:hypothetical protein